MIGSSLIASQAEAEKLIAAAKQEAGEMAPIETGLGVTMLTKEQ